MVKLYSRVFVVACAIASGLLVSNCAFGVVIYTNDFSSTVGTEWSMRGKSTTPSGARQFLGSRSQGEESLP